ncbi:hypothetical protein AMR42_18525 [Limnothrix sp. PR1529]|uniref:hypothetical protein n=1 Tax=Limnothrix sp. PR1529 TaxID=1704291 RepID=UPI00081F5580|nr:hypothetical protein [Limnothrix sp. PR1529]OCQ96251.1 hypothetical protein BCR12_14360 [Limnothrix sp. P13C2]PIB03683.1 hypothetical protein AMR42_18525 [Limnothrix sp. PR1529]
MARYTCLFSFSQPSDQLLGQLEPSLTDCGLNVVHKTVDYLLARERPGKVSYYRLVTVELVIDRADEVRNRTRLNLIVKNEELALQQNNHCRQMSEQIGQTLQESGLLELLSSVTG